MISEYMRALLTSKLDDPDPVMRAHAAFRPADREPEPVEPPLRPVAESIRLMRAARLCVLRGVAPGCGCMTCGATGLVVGELACWDCVERSPDSPYRTD